MSLWTRCWKEEDGNEAVQMACLMPIFMLLVAFIVNQFMVYDQMTVTTYAANEAIRLASVQDNQKEALQVAQETLRDRLNAGGVGWCYSDDVSGCSAWGNGLSYTDDEGTFQKDERQRMLFSTNKGWCNGSYLTLGVRTHKASLLPSWSSLKRLLSSGGPIYLTKDYVITARVESNELCK